MVAMYGMNENLKKESKEDGVSFKNPASKFSSFCFEWLETFVQAIIIVVMLMTFAFRVVTVDGDSMRETLHNQDRLIVMRWDYTPKNGDIVVISQGRFVDKPIIKRVIATEGQSLEIDYSAGTVTVDGKVLNETYIKEPMWRQGNADIPKVIPKGYYFVMGDNRNNSADSRFTEVGLIPREHIVGKASFRVFPLNAIGVLK